MKHGNIIILLSVLIIAASSSAALTGILSDEGPGEYVYQSIRGKPVTIYGRGIYRHMSADVAVQGIAQDYVTLGIAVPMLVIALLLSLKGSLRGRMVLTGTAGYFLVTYLFYTVMAMYNALFPVYVLLLGLSFFLFLMTLLSFDMGRLSEGLRYTLQVKLSAGFLIFNTLCIAFLWAGVVIPPLLKGTVIPESVEHYTTLIVQGLDLGLLLPAGFVSAVLCLKKKALGYLLTSVYLVFLSVLMCALAAKITAMGLTGQNILPAVVIIPVLNVLAVLSAVCMVKGCRCRGSV